MTDDLTEAELDRLERDVHWTRPILAVFAAARRSFSMQWQPIETAPKDHTWILLCDLGNNVVQARWMDFLCWQTLAEWEFESPAYWMPLPTPPQESEVMPPVPRNFRPEATRPAHVAQPSDSVREPEGAAAPMGDWHAVIQSEQHLANPSPQADAGENAKDLRRWAHLVRCEMPLHKSHQEVLGDGSDLIAELDGAASLIERQAAEIKEYEEANRDIMAAKDQFFSKLKDAQAEIARLREALEAAIAANELVLAQLKGGSDLTAEQVAATMNASLHKARAALGEKE